MASVSVVPVGLDTMQSWPVSVWYCWTGHNAVMVSVSVVPARQVTMQSLLVSVWYVSDKTQCSHG